MKSENIQRWEERYRIALDAYDEELAQIKKNQLQYSGELQPDGKNVNWIYNFTAELIESMIDSNLPAPKVEPSVPTDRNRKLAQIIESMCVAEAKRLKLEVENDEDERTTKIAGGNVMMVEWDNAESTHNTVGAVSVKQVSPLQFIPQEGVYRADRMDYLFLTFEETKERIEKRYGVDVSREGIDLETAEPTLQDDLVTQIVVFYKNDHNGIGCFSWVGDSVLIDDDEYQARGEMQCEKCGETKAIGQKRCNCGSKQWIKRNLKYEELAEDIQQFDGTVIPAMSLARDEDGEVKYLEVEVPEQERNPYTMQMEPVYEQIFDDQMNPIGEVPKTRIEQQTYEESTRIPYYTPKNFPICIRKNVSKQKKVLGESDVEFIFEAQDKVNKIATRLSDKCLNGGVLLTKPKGMNMSFSNGMQVVEVNGPDELSQIAVKDMKINVSEEINLINQLYYWSKSTLGVNDSSQGKADATATSGRAKEAQIARALGRQESKIKMKNAFYAELYRMIFEFELAYADEPRKYKGENDEGEEIEIVFNRYDFLEQDEWGNWYYNDQFTFTIDTNGNANENRQLVLEMMKEDLSAGTYGNVQEPETLLNFWKDRERLGYPNAKRQVARWQKKTDEAKAEREMQQQLLEQERRLQPTGLLSQEEAIPNEMSGM